MIVFFRWIFLMVVVILLGSTHLAAGALAFLGGGGGGNPTTNPPTSSNKSPPIQRVAIIGCGVAGLSLAHALENSPHLMKNSEVPIEVTLFDMRPSLDFEAGAGVQINGGMVALHKINPSLQRAVADAALPMKAARSRAKPWWGTSAAFDELLVLDIEDAVRKAGGEVEKSLVVDGELMFYTIMRGALQETLLENLPKDTRDRIQFGKCLSGIQVCESGEIQVDFGDGSSVGGFDLVVGCDGIKTAVKEYIETGTISDGRSGKEARSAIYSGIRIRYAVQDGDRSTTVNDKVELRQYFGEGAYSLAGIYGTGAGRPPAKSAFTIFLDQNYIGPFKKKEDKLSSSVVSENADWTQDVRSPADSRETMLMQIKDCGIPDVDVGPIISYADRFFELGVYFHNPFSFNGWSQEVAGSNGRFCTLCGDAAHAMPPFLGQGSNQAIQDAYLLAEKIHEYNSKPNKSDLSKLLKEYERVRWPATTSISLKAAFLGYVEAGSEGFPSKFRDVFFRTMGAIGVARKVYLDAATPKL